MRDIFQFLFLFLALQLSAQKKDFTFQSGVQGGLLEGERGSAFQLHTINGVQYKKWSLGLGAGLDYYHTRSIPLFLNVQKAFGNAEKAPFLYASGGYHFLWMKESEYRWGTTETKGGLYYDAGIGYRIPVMKKSALFFTLGFSQKDFSIRQTDGAVIAIYPSPPPFSMLYEYNLRRLSVQTGLRF